MNDVIRHTLARRNIPLIAQGKVRDIYEIDDHHLLFVTTDRISAFDVILPTEIKGKGEILNRISNFWFNKSETIIDNHLSNLILRDYVSEESYQYLKTRAVIVKKLTPVPVEAIVRGYIIGSGWKDYQSTGAICGIQLPDNLKLADKLPHPIYTPTTKAAIGDHDVNISFMESGKIIGHVLAQKILEVSIQLYKMAAEYALKRGIIIADTKFEFGLDETGQLLLSDEVLTPDSSRFWPLDTYKPGQNPDSYDKQIIRDYILANYPMGFPPSAELPQTIVEKTQQKYQEICKMLDNEARQDVGRTPVTLRSAT